MKRPFFFPPADYLCNRIVSRVPGARLRMRLYRTLGVKIGKGTVLFMATELFHSAELTIGNDTIIGNHCSLDGRGGLWIGNNVNISSHTMLVSATHDVQDPQFGASIKPIHIEDYAWLCTRCTVLGGVTIGRGAVVAAGAIVTKTVEPYHIVAGVPARPIGKRNSDLQYNLGHYYVSWQ